MIKKLTFILLAASCMQSMYSQNTEKNEKFLENKTLFEELTNVKKKLIPQHARQFRCQFPQWF